jgi:hypothetical protein
MICHARVVASMVDLSGALKNGRDFPPPDEGSRRRRGGFYVSGGAYPARDILRLNSRSLLQTTSLSSMANLSWNWASNYLEELGPLGGWKLELLFSPSES